MNVFYQKKGKKGTGLKTIFFILGAIFVTFSTVQAEGFLSKWNFFQRSGESPTEKERAMKDLLCNAIDQAAFEASQVNGFYHDPDLKINIPEQVKSIEKISKKLGVHLFWHDVELGLNRAAERATPKAAVLMKEAVRSLKFEKNAEREMMLGGSLTDYFRSQMEVRLQDGFRHEIERSISGEAALASYVEIKNLYASIPFVKNTDAIFIFENEVSRKALDGIFTRIAEQESRLKSVRSDAMKG